MRATAISRIVSGDIINVVTENMVGLISAIDLRRVIKR